MHLTVVCHDPAQIFVKMRGDLNIGGHYMRQHALYLEHIVGPFDAVISNILSVGITRGEIRADVDIHLSTQLLLGPLVIQGLIWQQHLKDDIAADVVDVVLPGLRPT